MASTYEEQDLYSKYLEIFGRIKSGDKLKSMDYGNITMRGMIPYGPKTKAAITLAVEDCQNGSPVESKKEFEEKIQKLFG